jgi:hypothetical protein
MGRIMLQNVASTRCLHVSEKTSGTVFLVWKESCNLQDPSLAFEELHTSTNRFVLRHVRTGRCVNAADGEPINNAYLVLKLDGCSTDDVRYQLQKLPVAASGDHEHFLLQSAKHSGRCVYPVGNSAEENTKLIFHDGCDFQAPFLRFKALTAPRAMTWFIKETSTGKYQDCYQAGANNPRASTEEECAAACLAEGPSCGGFNLHNETSASPSLCWIYTRPKDEVKQQAFIAEDHGVTYMRPAPYASS